MQCFELLEEYEKLLCAYVRLCNQKENDLFCVEESQLKAQLEKNCKAQRLMEDHARSLDTNLFRIFTFLKQCTYMDTLPLEKRQESLQFADAMTALEGVPSKYETEISLAQWARGEQRFADIYMKALYDYGVIKRVVTREASC